MTRDPAAGMPKRQARSLRLTNVNRRSALAYAERSLNRGKPKMTHDQKRRLANALIPEAANMIEEMHDRAGHPDDVKHIEPSAAAKQLAEWLQHLPGDSWDMRLPEPIRGRAGNQSQVNASSCAFFPYSADERLPS